MVFEGEVTSSSASAYHHSLGLDDDGVLRDNGIDMWIVMMCEGLLDPLYHGADELGGKKVRIPLEDDSIVTERGVEWFYPVNQRILLIN